MDDGESPPVVGRFLKLLIPGFESALKLPPAFSKMLNNTDLDSNTAVLKSCKGFWNVDVKKCDHGCLHFLGKTWEGYVCEHDLKEGDFIVFEHKGLLRFNTVMFDDTNCEKDFATSKDEEEEESSENDVMFTESSEDDDVEYIVGDSKQNVISQIQTTLTTSNFYGYINVPVGFVRSNGIKEDGTVTLRNDTGDSWLANLKVRKEFSVNKASFNVAARITGLSKFFKKNRLQVGDTCIFELDQSSKNSNDIVMNVLFRRMQ